MTFNIQNLTASLNKTGIAKSSHFEVQITGVGETDLERDMMFRVSQASLPGRTISTSEYKIYGPVQKIPYGATYTDASFTISLSEDMREKEYFERWQEIIAGTNAFGQGRAKHSVEYYDTITGTVTIRHYGEAGQLSSIHTLQEAYPLVIGEVGLNWSDDAAAEMAITMAFKDYKVVFNRSDQPGLGASFGFSFGPGGFAASARLPGIGTISGSTGLGVTGNVNTPFGAIRF